MTALGIIGIILAFALLMYMIMKGFNIYLTVFVCTLVVAVTSQMNIYDAYKVHFMTGFTTFFKNNYLIFLTGTLMAKAMDITGAAKSIAKTIIKVMGTEWAFISVPVACGVLCYGGVSAFVMLLCRFSYCLAGLPRRRPASARHPRRPVLRLLHLCHDRARRRTDPQQCTRYRVGYFLYGRRRQRIYGLWLYASGRYHLSPLLAQQSQKER
ncbi:MAG: hypothetical protein ACLSAF_16765 [Intestinimonas sp.]